MAKCIDIFEKIDIDSPVYDKSLWIYANGLDKCIER